MAHRFIVGADPAAAMPVLKDLWKDGVASSVDLLGEATVTQCEAAAVRGTLRRGDPDARRRGARLARAAAARDRLRGLAAARQPLRQGLRPDAAAAPRRAREGQARRRRSPATAAAARQGARRAPAHRHGVDGLARRRARADPRTARRGRVPRRTERRDGAAGLPARLAAGARHRARHGSSASSARSL